MNGKQNHNSLLELWITKQQCSRHLRGNNNNPVTYHQGGSWWHKVKLWLKCLKVAFHSIHTAELGWFQQLTGWLNFCWVANSNVNPLLKFHWFFKKQQKSFMRNAKIALQKWKCNQNALQFPHFCSQLFQNILKVIGFARCLAWGTEWEHISLPSGRANVFWTGPEGLMWRANVFVPLTLVHMFTVSIGAWIFGPVKTI